MPDPLRVLLVAPSDAAAAAVSRLRACGPVTPALAPSADLLRAALGSAPWDALLLIPGSTVRVAEVTAALAEITDPPVVAVEADRRPAALPGALLIAPGETALLADHLAMFAPPPATTIDSHPEPAARTVPGDSTLAPAAVTNSWESAGSNWTGPETDQSTEAEAVVPEAVAADIEALESRTKGLDMNMAEAGGFLEHEVSQHGSQMADPPTPSFADLDTSMFASETAPLDLAPHLDADSLPGPSARGATWTEPSAVSPQPSVTAPDHVIDLSATVAAAVAAVQSLAAAKGVGLEADIAPNLWVAAHAQHLTDAVTDFLRRSVKCTAEGTIRIEVRDAESEAWFRVTDQGFGVAESIRECFDPHFLTSGLLEHARPADTGSEANHPLAIAAGTISARDLTPGTEVTFRFDRRSAPDTQRAFLHPAPMTHPTPPQSPGDGRPEADALPTHQGDGHAAFVARPQSAQPPTSPYGYTPPSADGQTPPESFGPPAPQPGYTPPPAQQAPQSYATSAPSQPDFAPPAEPAPQGYAPPPQAFAPTPSGQPPSAQAPAFAPQPQPTAQQEFAPPAPQPQGFDPSAPYAQPTHEQAAPQGFEPAAAQPAFAPSAPAPEMETPAPPVTEAAPSSDKRRILVVEDNNDTRMLLERILRRAYDVVAVGDARSALVAMHNTRFDGLVLDINLGGKETGADILRIARSLDGYQGVFAIALTAYALPGDRERLLEKGFSEYISKPFTRSSLMESLERGVGVSA